MRFCGGRSSARKASVRERGFSLIELMVVLAIVMVLCAMAAPNIIETIANVKLRNSANAVASLLQEARQRAVRDNKYYTVRANGSTQAYIDLGPVPFSATDGSGNGSFDVGSSTVTPEPLVELGGTTQFATSGNPTFANSLIASCTGCVITGDTAFRVSFNSRGLPCKMQGALCQNIYTSGGSTQTVSYVYFLTDQRPISGWAAVSVSPAGRVKVWFYDGGAWK